MRWQGTENPDRLTLDFVLFFLSRFKARKKIYMSQLDLHVALKGYLKDGQIRKPIWETPNRQREAELSGVQELAKWQLSAPPSSPQLTGLFVQGPELTCFTTVKQMLWQTQLEGEGTFQKLPILFGETERTQRATRLPSREPTATVISKFEHPVRCTYFVLNRFLCEANTFSTRDHMYPASKGRWEFIQKNSFQSRLAVELVHNGVDVVNRLSTRHFCSWILCLFNVEWKLPNLS